MFRRFKHKIFNFIFQGAIAEVKTQQEEADRRRKEWEASIKDRMSTLSKEGNFLEASLLLDSIHERDFRHKTLLYFVTKIAELGHHFEGLERFIWAECAKLGAFDAAEYLTQMNIYAAVGAAASSNRIKMYEYIKKEGALAIAAALYSVINAGHEALISELIDYSYSHEKLSISDKAKIIYVVIESVADKGHLNSIDQLIASGHRLLDESKELLNWEETKSEKFMSKDDFLKIAIKNIKPEIRKSFAISRDGNEEIQFIKNKNLSMSQFFAWKNPAIRELLSLMYARDLYAPIHFMIATYLGIPDLDAVSEKALTDLYKKMHFEMEKPALLSDLNEVGFANNRDTFFHKKLTSVCSEAKSNADLKKILCDESVRLGVQDSEYGRVITKHLKRLSL